jgi:predicted HD superfamily hydrolase involved in NAD metabolism
VTAARRPPAILAPFLDALPRGLNRHVVRVVAEVDRLAPAHSVDGERALLAAWAHDIARALTPDDLLSRAEAIGLEILPLERELPLLLHGPVGAEMLQREVAVANSEVLDAVRYHTTGRAEMTLLEAVVFIGDKIEPAKVRDDEMRRVRDLAAIDLPAALDAFFRWHASTIQGRGGQVHPRARAAAQWWAQRAQA